MLGDEVRDAPADAASDAATDTATDPITAVDAAIEVETDGDGGGDGPEVPVVCTACETTTRVPLDDVSGTVERHNEQLHGGEAVAEIDPALREAIADLAAGDILDVE